MAGQTIRLTIKRGDKTTIMLTGTSYKDWIEQAVEYIYREFGDSHKGWRFGDIDDLDIEVENSRSKWKGWGGLKWCSESLMQAELNREGVQRDESDNPNPRQYSTFVFNPYPTGRTKLMKELRKW